eukprot:5510918-Amphidinium_carterae.1
MLLLLWWEIVRTSHPCGVCRGGSSTTAVKSCSMGAAGVAVVAAGAAGAAAAVGTLVPEGVCCWKSKSQFCVDGAMSSCGALCCNKSLSYALCCKSWSSAGDRRARAARSGRLKP